MEMKNLMGSAVLSGIILSIVSYGYAVTGGSVFGSVLFAFGLMAIVFYGLNLFTGDAGFIQTSGDNEDLMITLIGNVFGCVIGTTLLSFCGNTTIVPFVEKALSIREVSDWGELLNVFAKAMGCGIILTVAVKFARESKRDKDFVKILPLLLGVPLFLTCGFFHCVVDTFYLTYGMITTDLVEYGFVDAVDNFVGLFIVICGNLLGCNLPRIIMWDREF